MSDLMTAERAVSRWHIERNHKMHFAVVRDTPEGKEVRRSASGKPSSFKTREAAERCVRALNREALA